MIVVADASPINYLIEIGHIDVLPKLFVRVVIPKAVFAELTDKRAPCRNHSFFSELPNGFEIATAAHVDSTLQLNSGEREAICLAQEIKADALLMDEKDGRMAAERRGLKLIGTVGVLELAARAQLLDLSSALESLRGTRFFVSEELVEGALDRWKKWKAQR
jgi:predicted nucleic acid-binding protein